LSDDQIYKEILEWDRAKGGLKMLEDLYGDGINTSFHMVAYAEFARALRLIMESLETKPNREIIEQILEELKRK
jgi:hypothetical protein